MRKTLRWLLDKFQRNIQVRLTCYFLLILLPLVLVSLFANERSQQILVEQAAERSRLALNSAMDYIDLTLQSVEELSTLISTDAELIGALSRNGEELTPRSVVDFSQMMKQLANMNSINHIASQISIYHYPSGRMFSTNYGISGLDKSQQDFMHDMTLKNGTGILYMLPGQIIYGSSTFGDLMKSDSVTLVRSMDLYNPQREQNVMLITLNKTRLLNLIKPLLPSPQTKIYLTNADNNLIAGIGKEGETRDKYLPSEPDVLSVSITSATSKWKLTMTQPKSELYSKTEQVTLYMYGIITISILLALWISWIVYTGIASPLQKLSHGIKRLGSGKLNIQLENKRRDEFGYLTEAFNQMAQQQKHLIEDHYEQELRLAKTELKFLQSQINPHFLYNTLDSIYWTAKNYEADEISEMVLNLSRFFRLSLNKGREVFSVEESFSHLHYYIRIQQIRFLENFEAEYRMEEETKGIPLLKLLLQPLVENAILHGMDGKEHGGRLVVSSRLEEGFLVLEVRDNGSGIPQERLAYIQEELGRLHRRKGKLYSLDEEGVDDLFGLRNVVSRIKLYYGVSAELSIDSAEGGGTRTALRLPLVRCREDFSPGADSMIGYKEETGT
ncbi:sensor histidine kinase [Paenibacillus sp. UNC499MF]|uniref:sensor histidine kinase n=1 Tax=Paenibacillus sp. UNC499MF TaxID=1502751 RepID=UPI00089FB837|nr:sensor histidine kinase [Paenibacillus sp. UNC499MF]SEG43351.1 two-component system, sensor histidine kinase YesM [Paenibacillus sp. UNC499MF]